MAIIQISRIQHRRGLQEDLPQLASAELGWSIDTRRLYIGNGTLEEGAPTLGVTEILTEYSILNFTNNIEQLIANTFVVFTKDLADSSSGSITNINANNAVIDYTYNQKGSFRNGFIRYSKNNSSISFDEEYTEFSATDLIFSMSANTTHANLTYSVTTAGNLSYKISTIAQS